MREVHPEGIITPKPPSMNNLMKSLMANENEAKKSNDEGISQVAPPLPDVSNMAIKGGRLIGSRFPMRPRRPDRTLADSRRAKRKRAFTA